MKKESDYKILVVDDEEEIRRNIIELLDEFGYQSLQASNGEEALSRITFHQPDLVLLDLSMPNVNGLTVLLDLYQKYPHIKVIVITGIYDEELAKEAYDLGAKLYLTKPIQLDTLINEQIPKVLNS